MKPHKWAKEIKAWADGAEIEYRKVGEDEWISAGIFPAWSYEQFEYRIKPQPKDPQYLYVVRHPQNGSLMLSEYPNSGEWFVGKIKLETDDE